MADPAASLALLSFSAAALGHAAFAWLLARNGYLASSGSRAQRGFLAAVAVTGLWAAAAAAEPFARDLAAVYGVLLLDAARYAGWFTFMLLLLPGRGSAGRRASRTLMLACALAVACAAASVAWGHWRGVQYEGPTPPFALAWLPLPVLGLLLIEQLFRNLPEDSRWNAKPVYLGLAIVFVYDLYLFSEAALFGGYDHDALSVRAGVHLLAVPLLLVAARRRVDFIRRLQVSRSAAFYSATLLLAGGYLLFMSAVGYYVRYFGGEWGRALQIALLVAATTFLAALAFSGSLRAWVRVFVGKHFFSYRYDYREEWLRFTALLSSKVSPQETGTLIVRGLANMVESPAGTLWTRRGNETEFRPEARWNKAQTDLGESAASPFSRFLQDSGWVVDVQEFRASPRRYRDFEAPAWMVETPDLWLIVPLLAGDELLGFVTLDAARARMELNWEVRDLLKTAGRQAAGLLAQMRATEALLEARKFDAFNRMSAFVVHDLKNIVTQLSLMLKNAQRLHDNPEFQQDMLLTVESSLEKMRRLMLQLREGATPPGGAHGVELAPVLARLAAMAKGRGRRIEAEAPEGLATRGHDDRLERVLGHLVHNALDATPAEGRVWIRAARHSGQVRVEVGDTGAGMSEEFVRTRLFRPFNSTKHSGMGIGSYEASQYIRELGGSIEVDSHPGTGTTITLTMPLFEAQHEPRPADALRSMP